MSERRLIFWGLVIMALIAALSFYAERTDAQVQDACVDMKRVHASMEDLQRVRVELEAQTAVLKDIRDLLRKKKSL
jgi:hypothetical protein